MKGNNLILLTFVFGVEKIPTSEETERMEQPKTTRIKRPIKVFKLWALNFV